MSPSVSEDLDEPRDQFNLGTMLFIALAAVIGTTLAVWGLHFAHLSTAAVTSTKPFPRLAVLPFHSLSASQDDIRDDRDLTKFLIGGLTRISRVEALPPETDTDPVAVGRQSGVKMILIGKVERRNGNLRVSVQLVSARDGKQVWAGAFDGDSKDLSHLSLQIDNAVAPHLTGLLD